MVPLVHIKLNSLQNVTGAHSRKDVLWIFSGEHLQHQVYHNLSACHKLDAFSRNCNLCFSSIEHPYTFYFFDKGQMFTLWHGVLDEKSMGKTP